MINKIDPHSPTPIYAQVVEQFKNLILSGGLSAGESLPSVRQLAGQLEVNSLTIQKAYKQLVSLDLIVIKKGVGAFVSEEIKKLDNDQKIDHVASGLRPVVEQAKELGVSKPEVDKVLNDLWEENV